MSKKIVSSVLTMFALIAVVISVLAVSVEALGPTGVPEYVSSFGSQGSGDGQFSYAGAVDIDSSGNVYVIDNENNRVQKFSPDGTFISKWGEMGCSYEDAMVDGSLCHPKGITIDSDDNVYIADTDNRRIQKFSPDGVYISQFGFDGCPTWNNDTHEYDYSPVIDGSFCSPGNVAIDSLGNIYVADGSDTSRIQKFSPDGTFISKWGNLGNDDGEFDGLSDVAIDSANNVYTIEANNNRVQKFSPDGTFISKWGSGGSGNGQFHYPYYLDIDLANNIYISESENHRIQKFSSSGDFLAMWGSRGCSDNDEMTDDSFCYPYGIAAGSSGEIYIADGSNYRIKKYQYPQPTNEESQDTTPLTTPTPNNTTSYLLLPDGVSNASFTTTDSHTIPQDIGYSYPAGLVSFQFNTDPGSTETITLYFDLPGNPSDYVARKYDTTNHSFSTIPNATITRETYLNQSLIKLTYDITDGDNLDQDHQVNGTIIDPVGLGTQTMMSPDTGVGRYWLLGVKG